MISACNLTEPTKLAEKERKVQHALGTLKTYRVEVLIHATEVTTSSSIIIVLDARNQEDVPCVLEKILVEGKKWRKDGWTIGPVWEWREVYWELLPSFNFAVKYCEPMFVN